MDNDDCTPDGWALHTVPERRTFDAWGRAAPADSDGPGDDSPRVTLTLTRRADDWHACVTDDPTRWETGRSFHAAIGALAVSLGIVRVDE